MDGQDMVYIRTLPVGAEGLRRRSGFDLQLRRMKQAGQSILREGEGESEGYYRYAELPSKLFEFAPCDRLGRCRLSFDHSAGR